MNWLIERNYNHNLEIPNSYPKPSPNFIISPIHPKL